MSFPWLDRTAPAAGAQSRVDVAAAELANRAGLLYRLGYSVADATTRLSASIAWEYDPRPSALSDHAVAKIVADTYARHPK
ncbi:MAG: hypothetical protein ABI867_06290 [Kofleriaceae bacterium]